MKRNDRKGNLKPSALLALQRLQAAHGAWISGNDLADAVGWRYGGRLHELKAAGYDWEKRYVRGTRVAQYRLVEPAQLALAI